MEGVFFMTRNKSIRQFRCIVSHNAADFQNELNETMRELAPYDPQYETDIHGPDLRALIWFDEKQASSVREEFEMEGIRYICRECPLHDVNTDGRRKRVSCKYAENGVTHLDHACCEYFYKLLKQNRIEPILPEPEKPGFNTVTGTWY